MDGAVERAVRYVNAGADMIFPEGLENEVSAQQQQQSAFSPFLFLLSIYPSFLIFSFFLVGDRFLKRLYAEEISLQAVVIAFGEFLRECSWGADSSFSCL